MKPSTILFFVLAAGACATPESDDDLTIQASATTRILDVSITSGANDVEEDQNGTPKVGSTDLELTRDDQIQAVGMRFERVELPPGATITSAYVQFTADETSSEPTDIYVHADASDNAAPFTSVPNSVHNRIRTRAYARWMPAAWSVVGESAAKQRTPDLRDAVQEVVDRPGWTRGNSIAIIIVGTGRRTALAFEGNAARAPKLHIEYDGGSACMPVPEVCANQIDDDCDGQVDEGCTPPPPPPDGGPQVGCPRHTDPNDNAPFAGTGAWLNWCVRDPVKAYTTPEGNKGMRTATTMLQRGDATRNTVTLKCDIKFPQNWLDGLSLGGQHLFGMGVGPRRDDSANHIRLDIQAPPHPGGGGFSFRNGVQIGLYEQVNGQRHEANTRSTIESGVFTAGVWTPLEIRGSYERTTGRFSGYVRYNNGPQHAFSFDGMPNNPYKLGEFHTAGNVDGRMDGVEIRNLRYE